LPVDLSAKNRKNERRKHSIPVSGVAAAVVVVVLIIIDVDVSGAKSSSSNQRIKCIVRSFAICF
jgi:hypothetical protein